LLPFFNRSVITIAGTDDEPLRRQQISYHGKAQMAEIWAPYGFTYNIPPDSLCAHTLINGDSGAILVFPDDPINRIKNLKSGEVVIYSPVTTTQAFFKENGDLHITTNGDNGDLLFTVKKDLTIVVAGDTTITTAGVTKIDTTGQTDIIAGGDVNITATGAVNITGSTIELN
jgi:phage gp45-like